MYNSSETIEKSKFISLLEGGPGIETLAGCKDVMMQATQKALDNPDTEEKIFQYGIMAGDAEFRQELASFLTSVYADPVDKDCLFVTAGATQGLHLVVDILINRDTNIPVFVEDPTFFVAIKALKDDHGFNIAPVPTEEDGINLEALESLLKEYRPRAGDKSNWTKPYWSMIYMMTVYRNPTGSCMSPAKCQKIVKLARKYDILLFVEDIYNALHYGQGKSPCRLITYDNRNINVSVREVHSGGSFKECQHLVCTYSSSDEGYNGGHVLSNGTFSKIFSPGLRLGWIEGPDNVIDKLTNSYTSISGGCFNHYTSVVMTTAIRQGMILAHLQHILNIYKNRIRIFCESAKKNLPEGCSFKKPQGGFFIWIKLPDNLDGSTLLTLAENSYNLEFVSGIRTSASGKYKDYIRLSISFSNSEEIDEGVKRLGKAINECLKQR